MVKLPKQHWSIHFEEEEWEGEWTTAYDNLDRGYRWVVDSRLNFMLYDEEPWTEYGRVRCQQRMDDVYVLNVSHRGIGDGAVCVMVWFDKPNKWLVPLHCELV